MSVSLQICYISSQKVDYKLSYYILLLPGNLKRFLFDYFSNLIEVLIRVPSTKAAGISCVFTDFLPLYLFICALKELVKDHTSHKVCTVYIEYISFGHYNKQIYSFEITQIRLGLKYKLFFSSETLALN